MKRLYIFITILLLTPFFTPFSAISVFGQSVRISPLPEAELAGKNQQDLDAPTMLHLALHFSGLEEDQIPPFEEAVFDYLDQIRSEVNMEINDYYRGEALLEILHRDVLKRYGENDTTIDLLWNSGRFNCVSSAVFYHIAATYMGLSVEAVETPDHAFCRIETDQGGIDVETTNSYGFDPGTKQEFQDSFGNVTGYSYVPPGNYRDRDPVSDHRLLGLILQNRISYLQKRYDYVQTVPLAVDRHAVQQSRQSYQDLFDELQNLLSQWLNRKKFSQGMEFLEQVEAYYEVNSVTTALKEAYINNAAIHFTNNGEFDEAERWILRWNGLPVEKQQELTELVYQKRMLELLNHENYSAAAEVIAGVYSDQRVSSGFYQENMVYVYGKQAEKLASGERYLEAADILRGAVEILGNDPQLERGINVYTHNFSVVVHNEFVSLFNRRKYDDARVLIDQAVEQAGLLPLFSEDYDLLDQVQSR